MALENLELDISLLLKQIDFRCAIESDLYDEGLYGGGRGGGKSEGMRLIHLIRRVEKPRSKGQIWRRTFPELERNHIRPLLQKFPALREFYNEQKRLLTLPNGSTEEFCYADRRGDLEKIQGAETDDLGLEEGGAWEEDEWETLLATNRSTLYKPKAHVTANPGGRGHGWLKKRFITAKHPRRFYIQSLASDNAALMDKDPLYLKRLEAIKNKSLMKAWRFGDWDTQFGTFFSELSPEIHKVKPFKIPSHWKWFGSYDYGFGHPCVWLLWVCDERGNVYIVDEVYESGLYLEDQAAQINAKIDWRVAQGELNNRSLQFESGHDCWGMRRANTRSGRDTTIAEDFLNKEITRNKPLLLTRASINRKLGAKHMRQYLHYEFDANGVRMGPRLFFFEGFAEKTYASIERAIHAEHDAEDVEKVDSANGDVDTGDDGYDCARYGLMSRPPIAIPIGKPKLDRYKKTREDSNSWTVA